MSTEPNPAPDPLGKGAEILDGYLPKNLFGRYAFYVILGTTVLITSVSAAVTPISLVFGLLALPVLIILAALIVNFAIVFLEVNDPGSTAKRRRAAKNRLIGTIFHAPEAKERFRSRNVERKAPEALHHDRCVFAITASNLIVAVIAQKLHRCLAWIEKHCFRPQTRKTC